MLGCEGKGVVTHALMISGLTNQAGETLREVKSSSRPWSTAFLAAPHAKKAGMANQSRIRGFDGLRAVAILLVLLWHTRALFRSPSFGVLQPIVDVGWAGVDLFFGLSGFLITSLILREEETNELSRKGRRFSVKDFYGRRLLRIFPPYYTVLLVTVILSRFPQFPTASLPTDPAPTPLHVASLLFLSTSVRSVSRTSSTGLFASRNTSISSGRRRCSPSEVVRCASCLASRSA